jgi:hypothetical protein
MWDWMITIIMLVLAALILASGFRGWRATRNVLFIAAAGAGLLMGFAFLIGAWTNGFYLLGLALALRVLAGFTAPGKS